MNVRTKKTDREDLVDINDKHLCFLMHEGFHYDQPDRYKTLVQDAQYRCQQCGRTAKRETNLCMPVAL